MKVFKENPVFSISFLGVMLALSIVLSVFCQIRLFSDIRLDLSYVIITIICFIYGSVTGAVFAGGIALYNSLFFSAYGISPSWISANVFIGLVCGTVLHYVRIKKPLIKSIVDIATIVASCAIGLLLIKTIIECKLYGIPFAVKVVKNAVAFASDTTLMIVGYAIFLPFIHKYRGGILLRKINGEDKQWDNLNGYID